jgi:hypothetical protein
VELHELYSSKIIIRVNIPKMIRQTGRVARRGTGEVQRRAGFWWGNTRRRYNFKTHVERKDNIKMRI